MTLLHCVSGYPTPIRQSNLKAMDTLRHFYGDMCGIGYSAHSISPAIVTRAALHYQAAMIECHVDLDGKGLEYGGQHCWLPNDLEEVIALVGVGAEADGSGVKEPQPCERGELDWRADPSDGKRPMKTKRVADGLE